MLFTLPDPGSSFLIPPCSRVMSSKQATSPFASVVDGDDAMSQDNLSWEKEESAEAHGTPQLPLHSLLHGKAQHEEMQQLSSIPPESEWDSLVSAQQRMVRHCNTQEQRRFCRGTAYKSFGDCFSFTFCCLCAKKTLKQPLCEPMCALLYCPQELRSIISRYFSWHVK